MKKEPLTFEQLKEHYNKFDVMWLKMYHAFARTRTPDGYTQIPDALHERRMQQEQRLITAKQEMEVIEAILFERQVLGKEHDV